MSKPLEQILKEALFFKDSNWIQKEIVILMEIQFRLKLKIKRLFFFYLCDLIIWKLPMSSDPWINNYLTNKVGATLMFQDKTIHI